MTRFLVGKEARVMSYIFKLLELVELNNGLAKIRLSIGEDEKLFYLQLDDITNDALGQVIQSHGNSLMRLSFVTQRDPFTDSFSSTITVIKGSSQRKVDFTCSSVYVEQLEQLQQAEKMKDVEQLTFVKLPEQLMEPSQEKTTPEKKYNHEDSSKQWASFEVEEIVDDTGPYGWFGSMQAKKVIRNGLLAAVALSLMLAFSSGQFFATETTEASVTEVEGVMAGSNLHEHALTEKEVFQVTSLVNKPSYPMFQVERDQFYGLPKGYVALTFDDGPSVFTRQIVDILSEHEVAGTFFFVGTQIEKYPEHVSYVEEHGHVIGSHSFGHHNLLSLTPELLENDVLEAVTGLEGLVGQPVKLFRPPYGAVDEEVIEVLKQNDLKAVMWNRDPRDWDAKSESEILNYFKSVDPSGGIYILHENKFTVDALPEIIEYLRSKDLKIVGLQ